MTGKAYFTLGTDHNEHVAYGVDTPSGATNAGDLVAYDSSGRIPISGMPVGYAETQLTYTASEAIAAGALVNIDPTGKVRNADGSTSREAQGFALSAIANAASGTVYLSGQISGLTGLTPGSRYWLGAAGAVTLTPGTTGILQVAGYASSTTALEFSYTRPIYL